MSSRHSRQPTWRLHPRPAAHSRLADELVRLAVAALFSLMGAAHAATTITQPALPLAQQQLLVQIGSDSTLGVGDYVGSVNGLDTYFSYFVEVPPGLGQLQVDYFDADVGSFFGGQAHDFDRLPLGFTTSVNYQVIDPNGTVVSNFAVGPGTCAICNNAWFTPPAFPLANPIPGHWEIRVDMSSAVTGGPDANGYGIRAHDGDPSAGGTELNVYALSFIPPGAITSTGSVPVAHQYYPYITGGCTADSNDFDWDAGSIGFTSAQGFVPSTPTISGNGLWNNQFFSGWTSDEQSADYGIWTANLTVTSLAGANANFNNFYMGTEAAANPPPTSQPEAETFRLYLSTDAGAAPAKPQLGQNIIKVVSGADPPVMNMDTVIRIAVGINNPTAHPITFSTTNLVISSVPNGVRTTYQGNATVTQGTIVSEPLVGDTSGDIQWNPGIVPAGGQAQLEYDLLVSPTGGTIAVTRGGGNGTRATYVDETCSGAAPACSGAQLATATHTLGPLCRLAITPGVSLATRAIVGHLKAYHESERGTVVEWRTLSEHGTVGFHLERLDVHTGTYRRVNQRLLPALLHSRNGGTYRLFDPGARVGETHTYRLVELEATGNQLVYGPYRVVVAEDAVQAGADGAESPDEPVPDFQRVAGALSALAEQRMEARRSARATARLAKLRRTGSSAKVLVRETGLHLLGAARIAGALDLSVRETRALIARNGLALSNRGQPVATLAARDDDGLYFYARPVGAGGGGDVTQQRSDHVYSDENVYWIERRRGLPMATVRTDGAGPASQQYFVDTARAEGNKYTLTHLFDDPDDDYWMWDFRFAGLELDDCGTVPPGMPCYVSEYQVPSPGVASESDESAMLVVRLHGGSETDPADDHRVNVTLNGELLGTAEWHGLQPHTASFPVPLELLRDGDNGVGISAEATSNPDLPSIVYVNDFELRYPRRYRSAGGALTLDSAGHETVTVDGFRDARIRVFDLADPDRPTLLEGATVDNVDGGYRVSFVASAVPGTYLAIEPGAVRRPEAVITDIPSTLRRRQNRADYVVITASDLMGEAQRLADYRSARGLSSMVVDVEDIYDEFNFGIRNADAIWSFLRHAYTHWAVAPRYVLLAGDGSHDYKDYLGFGDSIIPTLLAPTPYGLFPSDNLYVDLVGADRLPEMAIGRLPVFDSLELQGVVDKIIAYEQSGGDWETQVTMAADAPDGGGEFPADSDVIAGMFPEEYGIERIYLDRMDVASAKTRAIDGLNAGRAFMNFIGHGGGFALGNQGLLTIADLEQLSNGDRLPVLTAQTCLVGQFGLPGLDGFGERLVVRPDRGAAAVWAPSGLSTNSRARVLAEEFYRGTFHDGERVVGDVILLAQRRFAGSGGAEFLLDIYNLIGDPAMVMK